MAIGVNPSSDTSVMKNNQQPASQPIQSNRHLKEWNDNIAIEMKARYVLAGKHKQEHSRSSLQEDSLPERAALTIRQMEEIQELRCQNRQTRIVMQDRHQQEDADLIQELSRESKPIAYQWSGVFLRRI